jgi:hypothetical protein
MAPIIRTTIVTNDEVATVAARYAESGVSAIASLIIEAVNSSPATTAKTSARVETGIMFNLLSSVGNSWRGEDGRDDQKAAVG